MKFKCDKCNSIQEGFSNCIQCGNKTMFAIDVYIKTRTNGLKTCRVCGYMHRTNRCQICGCGTDTGSKIDWENVSISY
jgi:hypothetical protein